MITLRKIAQFSLNKGEGAAKGLYNITNEVILEKTSNEGVSYWFDDETKDFLLMVSNSQFITHAIRMAGNNI